MNCIYCNSDIDDDSIYCTNCGQKVVDMNYSPEIFQEQIKITIGKDFNNDIVIRNPYISKSHAQIMIDSGKFTIQDLDSANGIYVNGRKILLSKIERTDEIRLSNQVIFNWELLDEAIQKIQKKHEKKGEVNNLSGNYNNAILEKDKKKPQPRNEFVRRTSTPRINRNFYFINYLIAQFIIIFFYLNTWGVIAYSGSNDEVIYLLLSLTCLIEIVIFLRFIYVTWKSVQEYNVRTTPAKAVGYLFIPFFNFYWIFQVFWGLGADVNKIIRDNKFNIREFPEGLPITMCILVFIPFVGSFVNVILIPIYIWKISNRINEIINIGKK